MGSLEYYISMIGCFWMLCL